MTRWETPEVPCSCYGCPGCMFAYESRCKYAGCCQPREFQHLRACGQPHAASLQVAGPNVRVSVSCKLQVRLYRISRVCGQPPAASLQAAGPNVSCERAMQVAGPLVRVSWACGQPHVALLQVVGTSVSGFAVWTATRGFLQAVGPFVRVSRGRVGSHTRLLCKL